MMEILGSRKPVDKIEANSNRNLKGYQTFAVWNSRCFLLEWALTMIRRRLHKIPLEQDAMLYYRFCLGV